MDDDEFKSFVKNDDDLNQLSPFPNILDGFEIQEKPVFWLRLVCFGLICNEFINRSGDTIGFEERKYPLVELLQASEDSYINDNIAEYESLIRSMTHVAL